jgi:hypothetical protein
MENVGPEFTVSQLVIPVKGDFKEFESQLSEIERRIADLPRMFTESMNTITAQAQAKKELFAQQSEPVGTETIRQKDGTESKVPVLNMPKELEDKLKTREEESRWAKLFEYLENMQQFIMTQAE